MTKQISPLRQRMIDDMAFRNMSASTQQCYTNAVAGFARYHLAAPLGSRRFSALSGETSFRRDTHPLKRRNNRA